jgi:GNAT superfamily N-acetyltransferase
MQQLAGRLHPESSWRHAGDLAWAATCAGKPDLCPTALWWDEDRLVGWGWLEGPGELSLQVDPRYPRVAEEVLAWAEKASSGSDEGGESGGGGGGGKSRENSGEISTTISEREAHIGEALIARGYVAAVDGPFFTQLGHDLTHLPPIPELPDGYIVQHCDTADVATRAEAHRAAWSYWNSTYSEQQHSAMRALWPYKPEFDLMAITADGTPAAYYQGWYDEESRVGLFEPVGTHPEHRRLSLSRVLGMTLLHAFAAAGARMAVVNPRGDDAYPVARLTYEALGFRPFGRTRTYASCFSSSLAASSRRRKAA